MKHEFPVGLRQLNGIAQMLDPLSDAMCTVIDVALDLEVTAGWANDPDPCWGGPINPALLRNYAVQLHAAYVKISHALGIDPCEQIK